MKYKIGDKVKLRKDSPKYKELLYGFVEAEGVIHDIFTTTSERSGKITVDYHIYSEEYHTILYCKIEDFRGV